MELEEVESKRGWMYSKTAPRDFIRGIEELINLATSNSSFRSQIKCPCSKCQNRCYKDPETVRDHLYTKGFKPNYYRWTSHGEPRIEKASITNKRSDGIQEIRVKMQEMHKQLENITAIVENLDAQLSQFVQQQGYALTQTHHSCPPKKQHNDSALSIYDHNLTFTELLNVAIHGGSDTRVVLDSSGVAGEHKGSDQGSLE